MLAHYLAIALAKFRKTPFTSAANILTLALGLACFIAAYGVASYWRSADSYHWNAARTVVVGQSFQGASGNASDPLSALSTPTLARYLPVDMPELERVARALPRAQAPVAAADRKAFLDAAYVDPAFLEVFDFEFVAGDASSALDAPGNVVLTEAAARRLFGDTPALGSTVTIDGDQAGTVTGVVAPIRQPSFMGEGADAVMPVEMLMSWRSLPIAEQLEGDDRWLASNLFTFVVLPPSLSMGAFNKRLDAFARARTPSESFGQVVFAAFPLGQMTGRELDRRLFSDGGESRISAVAVLLGLGAITLIVACVNYANLATAQAAGRLKEIGLRKVLGASRREVMAQAFLEAMLAAAAAVVVAILALALAAPVVRTQTDVGLLHFLTTGVAPIAFIAALVGGVALLAGAYPALTLSRVRPGEALEAGRSRTGPQFVARILVGVQFTTASFLLILVTVSQLQRAELERAAEPGGDAVIVLNNLATVEVSFAALQAELAGEPTIKAMSIVDRRPWSGARNPIYFTRTPAPDEATIISAPLGYLQSVGHDFFEAIDLTLLAGRAFDRERETIPTSLYTDDPARVQSVVLDETYMRRMGFASPEQAVDQLIYMPAFANDRISRPAVTLRIVGVVEADEARLEAWRADGNIFVFGEESTTGGQYPVLRVARADVGAAVAAITEAWDTVAPTVPVDVRFFDELFEQSYQRYARVGQLFMLIAATAFVIASVGLLGMAVHVTSRRRHEIGVRKTLGGTTMGIIRLLLIDFSKPILVANLLAWPLAYLAAQAYLAAFAERTPLTPAPFALSMAITLAIAWAAVIGEVMKAASVRPAEVLRHA